MKKILIVLLLLTINHLGYSQLTNLQNIANGTPLTASFPDISGTPYFTEFLSGEIVLANGAVFSGLIRYNGYSNEIEYKEGNDIYTLREGQVQKFSINNQSGIQEFEKGLYRKGNISFFYEKLVENNGMTLIKLYSVAVGQDATSSYGSVMGKAFVQSRTIYLCGEMGCGEIRNNKAVIALLPETLQEKAEDLIKNNKLNLKKEDDAISFITLLE